jgi:HEAT repeat protein
MASVSDLLGWLAPASVVLEAIVLTTGGIAVLLAFILLRRALRSRAFRRRDAMVIEIRGQWESIVNTTEYQGQWHRNPLKRAIVESLILDTLETASDEDAARLVRCLRVSGLVDARIHAARTTRGWRRRQALSVLGRMRAIEAIPALAEALEDSRSATVIAAVRGLGRMACPAAAVPLLDHLLTRSTSLPSIPVQDALLRCCRTTPELLVEYASRAAPDLRRVLSRTLSEVATGSTPAALDLLESDPSPEVRASAARLFATAPLDVALSGLSALAEDEEWFVRLRAIVALGQLQHRNTIPVLVKGLCDPHRFVRLRAARGLATMEHDLMEVLDLVEDSRDRYALQALLSELELSGVVLRHVERLGSPGPLRDEAEQFLQRVIGLGVRRLVVSSLLAHEDAAIRRRLTRLLSQSDPRPLVPILERSLADKQSGNQRKLLIRLIRSIDRAWQPPAPSSLAGVP